MSNYSAGAGSSNSSVGVTIPYCGLPWTAGQRVIQNVDTDGALFGCCQSIVFVTCMMETLESTHERGRAGDGMISRHETCISEHDFRLIAGFGSRNLSAEVGTGTWQDANVSRTINPHDINRFLQYTLFQHHSKVTPVAYADGFRHYESYMEAMLVLFGDTITEAPDLEKVRGWEELCARGYSVEGLRACGCNVCAASSWWRLVRIKIFSDAHPTGFQRVRSLKQHNRR